MSRARRVDANQKGIVESLRISVPGIAVCVTSSLGNGFPDLTVGYHGRIVLFEIKSWEEFKKQDKGLTLAERKFHREFHGCPVYVIACVGHALAALGFYWDSVGLTWRELSA